MSKNLVKVENEEWYQSLIEECQAIIVEGVFRSRMELIETYHRLGKRILGENDNFKRERVYGEKIVQRVAESLGKAPRTIWCAIQFAEKFPNLEEWIGTVPEGKNLSWHKVVQNYLPEPKESKVELPRGKYQVIYADPPWRYWEGGEKNQSRHYATMDTDKIKGLSVQDLVAEDCILFLWATYPAMKEAIETIEAWGFQYSTAGFVWVKSKKDGTGFAFGNGSWTRANTEVCLIGTRGTIRRKDATISQIIYEPREGHSKKPDAVREKIVQLVGKLPRIELFGRPTGHPSEKGWDFWGKEA